LPADPATATGDLMTVPARVSYVGMYYDPAGRLLTTVDVGTNGGTAWSRPATAPTASTATNARQHAKLQCRRLGRLPDRSARLGNRV
jgi:hypothetical protein